MGQQCIFILALLLAYYYVSCNATSPQSMGHQGDSLVGFKNQHRNKRYQNSEPNEYNAIDGKIDDSDIFDELEPDIYETLVRLVKDMQKGRERLSIRYKPNLGKRAQFYK